MSADDPPTVEPGAAEAAAEWSRVLSDSERIRHALMQIVLAGRPDPWATAASTIGTGPPAPPDGGGSSSRAEPDPEPAAGATAARERELTELLAGLRHSMLASPIAAQSLFSHLVAEGRAYATTEEGAALAAALQHDPALERLRRLWEVTSLNVLDETPSNIPPAWVKLIRDLAHGELIDAVVDGLRPGDER